MEDRRRGVGQEMRGRWVGEGEEIDGRRRWVGEEMRGRWVGGKWREERRWKREGEMGRSWLGEGGERGDGREKGRREKNTEKIEKEG